MMNQRAQSGSRILMNRVVARVFADAGSGVGVDFDFDPGVEGTLDGDTRERVPLGKEHTRLFKTLRLTNVDSMSPGVVPHERAEADYQQQGANGCRARSACGNAK